MRKFILIAAMVLASASAQAGVTRGLTLASNDEPAAATEQPKASEAPKAVEAPKYVDRPAAVGTTTEAPKVDQARPVADKDTQTPKTTKSRRGSTEARVINELHRHGIYW
jgi:outer membrane biosynthesis protein TonB